MKNLVCLCLFLSASFAFCAETLKIDFRYNTRADDGKNHLYWQTKDTKIKDSFDAVSGASKAKSTKLLRELQMPNKIKAFPKGLYALLLFAVSPPEQAATDMLQVQANGAQLTIFFVHRGNAYRITSDEKGRLFTQDSFSIAEGLADNDAGIFSIKSAYLKGNEITTESEATDASAPTEQLLDATDWNNIDWENISFVADTYDETAESLWTGKLKATYAYDILTITGTLKKVTPPKKTDEPESDTEQTAPTEDGLEEPLQEAAQEETLQSEASE